jgi:hypothetical protein
MFHNFGEVSLFRPAEKHEDPEFPDELAYYSEKVQHADHLDQCEKTETLFDNSAEYCVWAFCQKCSKSFRWEVSVVL